MPEFNKISTNSKNITEDKICKLKELFPEIITEGNGTVDFDKLRLALGDEVDTDIERYSFNWPGKKDAIKLSQQSTNLTLKPCVNESIHWDKTKNLYIEGDNLEVLKLLQRGYHGKIKMIYVDPPYNTGNDFIYNDSFNDTLENYKNQAGLASQSNPDASGRYHSKWCNMIYPRLKLARELLTDDGAIFVSIDEHEHANLLHIMNEIFGDNNYIDSIVWDKKASAKGVPPKNMMVNVHEYIVAYQKSNSFKFKGELRTEESGGFSNPDNDPRGPWRMSNIKSTTKSLDEAFTIKDPNTGREYTNTWAFSKETLEKMIEENRILWKESLPKQKEFMNEMTNDSMAIKSNWGVFDAQSTTVYLKKLMPEVKFDNPKPLSLMKYLLDVTVSDDDIVLDLFSGSGTTTQALMEINLEKGKNCQSIAVQLPECIKEGTKAYNAGYTNICELGKKRISLAANDIKNKFDSENNTLFDTDKKLPDLGFKVFKLDRSNFILPEPGQLVINLVSEEATELDIIYELMLKWGVNLSSQLQQKTIDEYEYYSVEEDKIICCLKEGLTVKTLEYFASLSPEKVFILDSILTDSIKLNAIQIFKNTKKESQKEIDLRTL